jgi:flagellar hook-associated protein 1 FlgK
MSGMSTFAIGKSALQNAQVGLDTASHNTANAVTPGYSRQRVNIQANLPVKYGTNMYIGSGAAIESIQRLSSTLLNAQVNSATSSYARNSTAAKNIGQLESMMSDLSNNVSSSLGEFFAASSALASTPQSDPARARFMDAAGGVVAKYQEVSAHLTELTVGVNQQIQAQVSDVNMYADALAKINASPDSTSNDLLDKQDQLLAKLSEKLSVRSLRNAEGQLSVFMANGQPLVLADKSFKLTTVQSYDDPDSLDVAIDNGANTFKLNENVFGGGQIAGLMDFRRDTLQKTRDTLGAAALAFANAINHQNKLGQTADGTQGTDVFALGTPAVFAAASNAGSGKLKAAISDPSAILPTEYKIAYTATGVDITRASDGNVTSYAGLPVTLDGMTLDIDTGSPAAGDTFVIAPARTAGSTLRLNLIDGRQIASGVPVLATADPANKGIAQVGSINANSAPWNASIKSPGAIEFTAPGTFTVNGSAPDSATSTPNGWEVQYNGWTLVLSGTPNSGDKFSVSASGLSGDGRNATLISALQEAKVVGGKLTPAGSYANLMNEIGSKTRIAESAADASDTILQQAAGNRDELSGVNLDEEAASLMKYQQMYQAATKLIQTANDMFDSIMAIHS